DRASAGRRLTVSPSDQDLVRGHHEACQWDDREHARLPNPVAVANPCFWATCFSHVGLLHSDCFATNGACWRNVIVTQTWASDRANLRAGPRNCRRRPPEDRGNQSLAGGTRTHIYVLFGAEASARCPVLPRRPRPLLDPASRATLISALLRSRRPGLPRGGHEVPALRA